MPAKSPAAATELAAVEVTTDLPALPPSVDPRWQIVRDTMERTRAYGRSFLLGQTLLGLQFAALKKEFGVREGRPSKTGPSVAEFRTWDDIVQAETGISRRSADRYIQVAERVITKLKTGPKAQKLANSQALALLKGENPLALPAEKLEHLHITISGLSDGETQRAIMEDLGLVPRPVLPPGNKGSKQEDNRPPQQIAMDFFHGPASALYRACSSPEYKTLLHHLPVTSEDPHTPCLAHLKDQAEQLAKDIAEVMSATGKPAA